MWCELSPESWKTGYNTDETYPGIQLVFYDERSGVSITLTRNMAEELRNDIIEIIKRYDQEEQGSEEKTK